MNWPEEGKVVSDYGFCQDRIYARRQLDGEDWNIYDSVARRMERLVHPPDVLVHLDASPEILLERIARRGRDFERVMTAGFLNDMRGAYARYVAAADCPVLEVDCGAEDCRKPSALRTLIRRIEECP